MLKVSDKINPQSEADMNEVREARLAGKWIVTNSKRTIVKFIGDEQGAKEFFNIQRTKRGSAFLVGALEAIEITKEEMENYHRIHNLINNYRNGD